MAPNPLGKAEKPDGPRQSECDQGAAGHRGRGPAQPPRTAEQDQQSQRERDAGLDQEGGADHRDVLVAMDIEVGMADGADQQRRGEADPDARIFIAACCSFNASAVWPLV